MPSPRDRPYPCQEPATNRRTHALSRLALLYGYMAPNPISLPCALAFPPPSHRDATTPSPYWTPHFMTQERIMFSNSTPSAPRLSPPVTMSDDMLLALTLHLHCASILQPATPPQVVAFESWAISICLNRFILLNHGNLIFEPACVFLPFPLQPLLF